MRRYKNFVLVTAVIILLFSRSRIIFASSSTDDPQGNNKQHLTYEINDNGEAVITGGTSDSDGLLVIPENIGGYHVVGVAEKAFAYSQDIRSLRIEDGVRYIGAYAFAGCRNMNTPSLGEGIQAVGEGAFRDDLFTGRVQWRGDVFLPDSIMSIDGEAFACCSNLWEMDLPEYADIDPEAFEETSWQEARDERFQIRGSCLEEINGNTEPVLEIPYGVTSLKEGNWVAGMPILDNVSEQTAYEEIIFPDTVVELGVSCLASLRVKRIEIPGSVRHIPHGVFKYGEVCELVLSEGTEIIGKYAFYEAGGFETIRIPSSVRVIEEGAFTACRDLRRITIPGTVERVREAAFSECEKLEEVIYEEGIREINCGYWGTQIKRIQFPESTVRIGGTLVYAENLERVYIPSGVKELNDILFSFHQGYSDRHITVYGQKGSRAEELAIQSGYEFIEVENGDGMP